MTVNPINMSDETWRRLLAVREGSAPPPGPEGTLYGPIAAASGRFVLAQVGQSLDGRVATPSGDARDISGPEGLAHLHRCRALVDAVIVGENTVSCDDPRLSVRLVDGPDPARVVIDCHARLSGSEGLFHDGGARVIVFQSAEARRNDLRNAEIIPLRPEKNGLSPQEMLKALSGLGLHRVLVEGGARTIARFIEAGLVDRLHVAVSPLIIGSGPSGISLSPVERLSSALRPEAQIYSLGSDILFDCPLKPLVRPAGQ
ncbi:RibD family protein [Martelella mediterranea]|uniref:Riboflavin biosynthesis protein RibD n=1 Tax=Martelella mediterranea DSM 17316 TaxID=1122214 RepID=A0A1U9Z469_9HYPH|nr:dihydrofolate reductase family protein [Martelella mediterranea]AQZ52454.1 Riboflavin biosynthesis protein RibD [Martelella mediterranea DSM 17316]